VLSRCLQLNLTPLPRAQIGDRLAQILQAESIAFEESALGLVAAAAQGSLRDALSLLDQAIAFGAGEVREDAVRAMLGVVDRGYLYRIVDALLANDGKALLAEVDALAASGQAFAPALDELASLFHRVAIAQVVPDAPAADDGAQVAAYAARMSPENVQLAYQIAVQGRSDLALAPDEAIGFSMTLLRLLAFEPVDDERAPASAPPRGGAPDLRRDASPTAQVVEANVRALRPAITAREGASPPTSDAPRTGLTAPTQRAERSDALPASDTSDTPRRAVPEDAAEWPAFVASLKLIGMAAQLGAQSEWKSLRGNALTLAIPASQKHLADKVYADKLKAAIEAATGRKLLLAFEIGEGEGSLAAITRRDREQARAQAEAAFRNEPFVRDLVNRFGATVRPETIESSANDAKHSMRQDTP